MLPFIPQPQAIALISTHWNPLARAVNPEHLSGSTPFVPFPAYKIQRYSVKDEALPLNVI